MMRWIALLLGFALVACAGCSAGVPDHQAHPEAAPVPIQVSWEISTALQTLSATSGGQVSIDGWSALVTARFSAPVDAEQIAVKVDSQLWHTGAQPVQTDPARVTVRLWSELAGNNPVTLTLAGPAEAVLTILPRTPPLLPGEAEELEELGRRIWAMAVTDDEAGLQALMAPPAHLTVPGGEFSAGGSAGLTAVLKWAKSKAGAPPQVRVEHRLSYSSMDVIMIDTGRGRLAAYVTIPGRRLVKLFGIAG